MVQQIDITAPAEFNENELFKMSKDLINQYKHLALLTKLISLHI